MSSGQTERVLHNSFDSEYQSELDRLKKAYRREINHSETLDIMFTLVSITTFAMSLIWILMYDSKSCHQTGKSSSMLFLSSILTVLHLSITTLCAIITSNLKYYIEQTRATVTARNSETDENNNHID